MYCSPLRDLLRVQYITRFCKSTDRHGAVRLGCLLVVAVRAVRVVLLQVFFKRSNSRAHAISERCSTINKSRESFTVLTSKYLPNFLSGGHEIK